MDFVLNNWYLFLALVFIIYMLFAGNIAQIIHGIKDVNVAGTVRLMNHDDAIVLDVCEPKEYQAGHIPGSINLPMGVLAGRLPELEKYKSRPIIVNCRSGQRSQKSAVTLRKNGFESVYLLSGGMLAWQRDNLPVEK